MPVSKPCAEATDEDIGWIIRNGHSSSCTEETCTPAPDLARPSQNALVSRAKAPVARWGDSSCPRDLGEEFQRQAEQITYVTVCSLREPGMWGRRLQCSLADSLGVIDNPQLSTVEFESLATARRVISGNLEP